MEIDEFVMGQSLLHHKYIIEQELGRGGFGITYKATNAALSQTVVVKTLNESLRQDPNFANFQRQFQEEAQRLARFAHRHIVRVSDFFIEDGLPYIVMDYIPGQTLDTIVLPDRPLPEAIALDYIRQVGEAVKVVHQNGLLHRDIKPQNLILRQDTQQVVLIDFGIAREFTSGLTQTHTHLVSEGYAPIEQYLPKAKRTPATDVYGLAATLYTLLTAQVPIAATLRDRLPLAAPHEVCPELSAMVSQAVMRGMAVEPHHRPASIDEWLALLGNLPNHQFSTAAGPTSQVATVAVAPAPRRSTPTEADKVAIVPPAQPSGSRLLWILPLVGLAGLVPLMLSEARSRSPNSPDAATVQPSTPASPTAVPEEAFTPPAEEPESPIPTVTEPASSDEPASDESADESAPANEDPSPDDLAPPPEAAVPVQPEPNVPVEAQPLPSEPEPPARETEEPRRSEEQTREDRKREQEQAREARRREQEQAREARRDEREDGREEDRGGEERD